MLYELTPAVAISELGLSASFHGDPFDRTITAPAKTMGLPLTTTDPRIRQWGEWEVIFYRFGHRN